MTEDEYRSDLRAKGYADPIRKVWEPGLVDDEHHHPNSLYIWVTAGQMTLDVKGERGAIDSTTIGPGEAIELPALAQHKERAGPNGVTFLVARR